MLNGYLSWSPRHSPQTLAIHWDIKKRLTVDTKDMALYLTTPPVLMKCTIIFTPIATMVQCNYNPAIFPAMSKVTQVSFSKIWKEKQNSCVVNQLTGLFLTVHHCHPLTNPWPFSSNARSETQLAHFAIHPIIRLSTFWYHQAPANIEQRFQWMITSIRCNDLLYNVVLTISDHPLKTFCYWMKKICICLPITV